MKLFQFGFGESKTIGQSIDMYVNTGATNDQVVKLLLKLLSMKIGENISNDLNFPIKRLK